MKNRLLCILLELNSMLLGGLNKDDLKFIEKSLIVGGEASACYLASQGALKGKSSWLVRCVVSMIRSRMELKGLKAVPSLLEQWEV